MKKVNTIAEKMEQAHEYLDDMWRPDDGLKTANGHPDNWGENLHLYVQAHIEMGNLDRAIVEYELWKQSRFPETGFSPHYMLGPHKRLGIETNFVDARVQKVIKLENGRMVTPLAGPPNWALAAEAIADAMEPERAKKFIDDEFDILCQSSMALYEERDATNVGGLIVSLHQDELTLRDGVLNEHAMQKAKNDDSNSDIVNNLIGYRRAILNDVGTEAEHERLSRRLDVDKFVPVVDVAINALMDSNNDALMRIARKYSKLDNVSLALRRYMKNTKASLPLLIKHESGLAESTGTNVGGTYTHMASQLPAGMAIESFLAGARSPEALNKTIPKISEQIYQLHLSQLKPIPTYYEKHGRELVADNKVERGATSPTLTLEIARSLRNEYDPNYEDYAFNILGGLAMFEMLQVKGFPRSIDPNSFKANTSNNALGRRIKKAQNNYAPVAASFALSGDFVSE